MCRLTTFYNVSNSISWFTTDTNFTTTNTSLELLMSILAMLIAEHWQICAWTQSWIIWRYGWNRCWRKSSKGTRLCLVQPTGATIQERNHRKMVENFGFAPDAVANYNSTWHRSFKATPEQIFEGKKENPIERKVVKSVQNHWKERSNEYFERHLRKQNWRRN